MSSEEIDSKLKMIFSTVLHVPPEAIGDDLAPVSCPKWDSLNHIHLVHAIEEEFAVSLEFEVQMEMLSFGAARAIVRVAVGQG